MSYVIDPNIKIIDISTQYLDNIAEILQDIKNIRSKSRNKKKRTNLTESSTQISRHPKLIFGIYQSNPKFSIIHAIELYNHKFSARLDLIDNKFENVSDWISYVKKLPNYSPKTNIIAVHQQNMGKEISKYQRNFFNQFQEKDNSFVEGLLNAIIQLKTVIDSGAITIDPFKPFSIVDFNIKKVHMLLNSVLPKNGCISIYISDLANSCFSSIIIGVKNSHINLITSTDTLISMGYTEPFDWTKDGEKYCKLLDSKYPTVKTALFMKKEFIINLLGISSIKDFNSVVSKGQKHGLLKIQRRSLKNIVINSLLKVIALFK
jgi:hypothetical protein